MKKYISLLVIIILALLIWAINDFSRDVGLVLAAIVPILTFIQLVLGTAKSMDERFFNKKEDSPIRDIFSNSHPLAVQIIEPTPAPVEKVKALQELRDLPNPSTQEQIAKDVEKILDKKADLFWAAVTGNPILIHLAQTPFWAEGLVLVFEQNNYSFPQNDGKLLAQLLGTQWRADKFGGAKIISIDVLHSQLGKLAYFDFPSTKYPVHHEGFHHRNSPYSQYELMLEDLGKLFADERSWIARYIVEPVLRVVLKDPNKLFEKIEKLPAPWRSLVVYFIYSLIQPLGALASLLLFPFRWAEGKLNQFAHDYGNDGALRRAVNRFWYKFYLKLKKGMKRFFDNFNIKRIANLRRAMLLIQNTQKVRVLDTDGEHIWFTNEYWRDYFTAQFITSDDLFNEFIRKYIWHDFAPVEDGEEAIIMACGLRANPAASLQTIIRNNIITAAKCFLKLDGLSTANSDVLRKQMLDKLVSDIWRIPEDGNSSFIIRATRAMRSLTDNPYYANVVLEKLPEIYDRGCWRTAAKLVASFGPATYDMLFSKAQSADGYLLQQLLVGLGELRDPRALPFLRDLYEKNEDINVQLMAAVVLATYFNDEAGQRALERFLRFEHEHPATERCHPWANFDVAGEEAIAFGLKVLEKACVDLATGQDVNVFDMIEKFSDRLEKYENNPVVTTMVSEILLRTTPLPPFPLKKFAVQGLGKLKSKQAVPILTPYLFHADNDMRSIAMNALQQIDGEAICSTVTGYLYANDLGLVREAIRILTLIRCLDAVPALKGLLNSHAVARSYPADIGYPIALSAMEALVKIGNDIYDETERVEARRKIASECLHMASMWCKDHLDDQTPISTDYRTISYRVLNYLDHEIGTDEAHTYLSEWVQANPGTRLP